MIFKISIDLALKNTICRQNGAPSGLEKRGLDARIAFTTKQENQQKKRNLWELSQFININRKIIFALIDRKTLTNRSTFLKYFEYTQTHFSYYLQQN